MHFVSYFPETETYTEIWNELLVKAAILLIRNVNLNLANIQNTLETTVLAMTMRWVGYPNC